MDPAIATLVVFPSSGVSLMICSIQHAAFSRSSNVAIATIQHNTTIKQPLPSRTQSPAIDPAWKRGKARCKETFECRGEERRERRIEGWEAEMALICK